MQSEIITSLEGIEAADWDALVDADFPFARHAFLVALERHESVGEKFGWLPRYLLLKQDGQLVAALPLYEKYNSYGELVFDWAWADAYQRAGLPYYPKLVAAIPYTPAIGPRCLVREDQDYAGICHRLIETALDYARAQHHSSFHLLFPHQQEKQTLQQHPGLMMRMGCQFHWHNQQYDNFDHYLSHFTSKKRKQIRRERRSVAEQNIHIEILNGHQAEPHHWQVFSEFYTRLFDTKYGMPTFNTGFFNEIGSSMPDNVLLILARDGERYVAGAFCVRGEKTLYGRHWGCEEFYDKLHFELCYYQGLEYCIDQGLQCFQPGAQGEHKVARGFLPVPTWSAHWIAHEGFRQGIEQFIRYENQGVDDYIHDMEQHSPFKQQCNEP